MNVNEHYYDSNTYFQHIIASVDPKTKNYTKSIEKYSRIANELVSKLNNEAPIEVLKNITLHILNLARFHISQMSSEEQTNLKLSLDEEVYNLAPLNSNNSDKIQTKTKRNEFESNSCNESNVSDDESSSKRSKLSSNSSITSTLDEFNDSINDIDNFSCNGFLEFESSSSIDTFKTEFDINCNDDSDFDEYTFDILMSFEIEVETMIEME